MKTYHYEDLPKIDQQIGFNFWLLANFGDFPLISPTLGIASCHLDHLRFEVCVGHRFNLGLHVAWHQPPDTTGTDAGFEQRYVGPEMEATLECRCAWKERKERNSGEKDEVVWVESFWGRELLEIYVYIFIYIYMCVDRFLCVSSRRKVWKALDRFSNCI